MKDVVPDYMTALVGYRAWNVTFDGCLLSINSDIGEPWPGKEKKRAICTRIREGWAPGMVFSSKCELPVFSGAFEEVWGRRKMERARRNHVAPMPDCHCGIYAAKSDRSSHFDDYAYAAPVWGEVYLWGKIQEYTEGYRAEFAYPKSLKTRDATLAQKIAERYGVSCEVVVISVEEKPRHMTLSEYRQYRRTLQALNRPLFGGDATQQKYGLSGSFAAVAKFILGR